MFEPILKIGVLKKNALRNLLKHLKKRPSGRPLKEKANWVKRESNSLMLLLSLLIAIQAHTLTTTRQNILWIFVQSACRLFA